MEGAWQLHLYGDFRLIDGSGEPVALPTSKVEGLLGVLAAHPRFGIGRDETAEILWPARPLQAQRANLRQALALLRKSIGADSIDSTRTHLRLTDRLQVACDLDQIEMRRSDAFMPGHEGEWFEEMRLGQDATTDLSVVDHYLETLRWYASRSATNMYGLLRANPALVRGIEFSAILDLLEEAGPVEDWQGWSGYWRGCAEEDLALCAQFLREALRDAKQSGDVELASEACLELGKVYARTGRFDRADRICEIAKELAQRNPTAPIRANDLRLRGTVQVQRSGSAKGLELFLRAEELIDDPVERAILQSGRAFFEALVGHLKEASDALALIERSGCEAGHQRIHCVCALTRGLLAAHGGSHATAIDQLEKLLTMCRRAGSLQIVVYVEELLAKLLYLSGDKGSAQKKLRSAAKGRMESRMAVTPLEAQRVQSVQ